MKTTRCWGLAAVLGCLIGGEGSATADAPPPRARLESLMPTLPTSEGLNNIVGLCVGSGPIAPGGVEVVRRDEKWFLTITATSATMSCVAMVRGPVVGGRSATSLQVATFANVKLVCRVQGKSAADVFALRAAALDPAIASIGCQLYWSAPASGTSPAAGMTLINNLDLDVPMVDGVPHWRATST